MTIWAKTSKKGILGQAQTLNDILVEDFAIHGSAQIKQVLQRHGSSTEGAG